MSSSHDRKKGDYTMKKRMIILTAAISASLVFMTGCSKEGNGAVISGVESSSEGESTEQSKQETEITKEETMKEETVETSDESEKEPDEEKAGDEMLKIWGTITEVSDDTITVDNQSGVSSEGEIIFHIDPERTYVIDGITGLPVTGEDIKQGKFEAYLEASAPMTMSLPPQTTPYMVIVNIPEDSEGAQFVIAAGEVEETEDGKVLETVDGKLYKLAEQVEILPYLTRNIVMPEDIGEGSKCLVWLDSEETVEKIVLFGE